MSLIPAPQIVQKKNLWFLISLAVILIGISTMVFRAFEQRPFLNFGIDFTGGTTIILKAEALQQLHEKLGDKKEANIAFIATLRETMTEFGLEKSHIQITGDKEVIIRTQELKNTTRVTLLNTIQEKLGYLEILEIDMVGPTIGDELKEQSFWIIILVSIALLIYISWRFEFIFGAAALIAVIHDALVVMSMAALFDIEINTAFVAAILTVLGYSINDTIVIFDRIRENMHKHSEEWAWKDILNISIRQTLSRTAHTSTTTLTVILSLLIFGGTTLKAFMLVLLIGIISGTYSSIFVASPVLYQLLAKREASES